MKRSSVQRAKQRNAVQSFRNAAETIGSVRRGMSLFCITRGQWSMIDAILHTLDCVGPAHLSLWTWTIADYEVQCLTRLREDRRITQALLVVDYAYRLKDRIGAPVIMDWKNTFGPESVRYCKNHAKIATIETACGQRYCLRGSMNLNFNPRFEQFDMTEGGSDFDLVREIEAELPVLEDSCSSAYARAASKLGEAFSPEQLRLFDGVKIWAK